MIEARVTCTCTQIILPDLGVDLIQGQVIFIPEAQAKASEDLTRARHARAVSVHFVQRFTEQRSESPAAPAPVPPPPHPSTRPVPPPPPALDPEDVADRVVQRLGLTRAGGGVGMAEVRAEVGRQLTDLRAHLRADLRTELIEVLQAAGAEIPAGATKTTAAPSEPEPVFIPSRIGEDLKADIGVEEGTSTVGVSDAAAALRAARGGAGKKERTKRTT